MSLRSSSCDPLHQVLAGLRAYVRELPLDSLRVRRRPVTRTFIFAAVNDFTISARISSSVQQRDCRLGDLRALRDFARPDNAEGSSWRHYLSQKWRFGSRFGEMRKKRQIAGGRPAESVFTSSIVRRSAWPFGPRRPGRSDPFLDHERHAVGSGHDAVVVGGGLADHVGDGEARVHRGRGGRGTPGGRGTRSRGRRRPSPGCRRRWRGSCPNRRCRASPARSSRSGAGTGFALGRSPTGR